MKKKFLAMALGIAVVLSCTACGGGSSDAGSSAKSSGKTELELFPQNLRTRIRFRNW